MCKWACIFKYIMQIVISKEFGIELFLIKIKRKETNYKTIPFPGFDFDLHSINFHIYYDSLISIFMRSLQWSIWSSLIIY